MKKKSGVQRSKLEATFRYLLLTFVAVTALIPAYIMFAGSFKTQGEFLRSPFGLPLSPSFSGYRAAWTDNFPNWLANSFLIVTGAVIVTEVLAALAAWGFARFPFKGRETILGIIVSLMVVPPVVLLIPLFQLGVELTLISTLRLVILIYVGLMLPFSIYMLTNFFKSIPESILESASIDGASSFKTFKSIVLPLSGAPLATLAVVNLLWAWNELLLALVFLQNNEKKTLMVGITGFQSRYSLDIPTVMAGMSIATLPLVIAYLFGQRFFIAGLTAGSTKGE
jgi:ABC-type glycerol-3-phosphate transport system permease component